MAVKSGLSDAAGFARKLEQAFAEMVELLDRTEGAGIRPTESRKAIEGVV
jgi:hypothetical protein